MSFESSLSPGQTVRAAQPRSRPPKEFPLCQRVVPTCTAGLVHGMNSKGKVGQHLLEWQHNTSARLMLTRDSRHSPWSFSPATSQHTTGPAPSGQGSTTQGCKLIEGALSSGTLPPFSTQHLPAPRTISLQPSCPGERAGAWQKDLTSLILVCG